MYFEVKVEIASTYIQLVEFSKSANTYLSKYDKKCFYLLLHIVHGKYLAKQKKITQYNLNSSSTFLIIKIQVPSVYRGSI